MSKSMAGLRKRYSGETSEADLGSRDVTASFAAGRCIGPASMLAARFCDFADRVEVLSISPPESFHVPLSEKFW